MLQGVVLFEVVILVVCEVGVQVYVLFSGCSCEGIDLGSDGVKVLCKFVVVLVMGEGVVVIEIGLVWFLFDQQLYLFVSKLDLQQLGKVFLDCYIMIVLFGGIYIGVDIMVVVVLKCWVQVGGLLVIYGSVLKWVIEQKFVDGEKFGKEEEIVDESCCVFGDQCDIVVIEWVSGNIFSVDVDISYLLVFGVLCW